MRVGIEIGGTFTDLVALDDEGGLETCKVLSTPGRLEEGALAALRAWGGEPRRIEVLVHGSTVATNAVLERRGAVTALITTEGFRDLLEIQRHERKRVYELYYRKALPLVPRERVLEVRERLGADGGVVEALADLDSTLAALEELVRRDEVASVAIVLLHAYRNPAHERALREAIEARLPGLPVTLSSDILPEFREYERASTTVMSAYLKPVVGRYMSRMAKGLAEEGFAGDLHVMQSNGGIFPVAAAEQQAVNVILSGPAAGVMGALHCARAAGIDSFITFDMGGTSTDVCLVRDGQPLVTTESAIDELPIQVPMVEIVTVGAGGGSIAWRDAGGMLRVGPESAGARPGPACYGQGGERPTITDANLLLGLIRPDRFFGGRMRLEREAATAAIAPLARAFQMSPGALADGIRQTANANMVQAIRLVSVERGHDPRDYALLAFGGAGGLHACDLALELGIGRVLVPRHPGLLSAYGLLAADFKRDFVQTLLMHEAALDPAVLHGAFAELERRARAEFAAFRVGRTPVLEPSIDLRYAGQAFALNLPLDPARLGEHRLSQEIAAFHDAYAQRYGHAFPEQPIEIVNARLTARAAQPRPPLVPPAATARPLAEPGEIVVGGRPVACTFLDRASLPAGYVADGPLVVEEATATTLVPPGRCLRVDEHGSLVIERVAGSGEAM